MELNLLPVAVANTRPNHQVQSYSQLDTLFKNCYFDVYTDSQTDTQKVYCIKRAGVNPTIAWTAGTYPNGHTVGYGLGCFTSQPFTSTKVYFAVYGASTGQAHHYYFDGTTVTGFAAHSMPTYKRINYVDIGLPDDTYTVGWTAGTTLYLVKDGGVVSNSTPHGGSADLTRPTYLNNRVFVGDRVTGQINQSDLGAYATFGSDTITVESAGGKLVDLARFNNFIVAFKEFSTEFFEDVANQNGTVLGRIGQAEQQLGCVHPNTIVDTGAGELVWLATDRSGHRSVRMLKNSFEVDDISDPDVSKNLRLTAAYDSSYAYMCNTNGRQFYVLTLKADYTALTNTSDFANVTFAYDFKTKLWAVWSTDGEATSFVDSATGATIATLGRWDYAGACKNSFNSTYVQAYDTGGLYVMDEYYTTDRSTAFTFMMQFNGLDFGTWKRKFINRLSVYSDKKPSTYVDYLDFYFSLKRQDSYYSPTTRLLTTIDVFSEQVFTAYALGSGRQFTLTMTSTSAVPIRVSAINIDYDIGEGHGIS